jgi:hypothetical protein
MKVSNIKFYVNPSIRSRLDTCIQTAKQTDKTKASGALHTGLKQIEKSRIKGNGKPQSCYVKNKKKKKNCSFIDGTKEQTACDLFSMNFCCVLGANNI